MVSRIDLGPDGGPYVELDEDAGDLVIRVPNNTVDFDSNDLLNAVLQNATMDSGSLDGVSLASSLDANNQDLNSVGTASVTALEADGAVIGGIYHYASRYEGADADDRLDNALSAAGSGDIIYLESTDYSDDRTISKDISLIGTNPADAFVGTRIDGSWSLDGRIELSKVDIAVELSVDNLACHLFNIRVAGVDIVVNADRVLITNSHNITVTFSSGTEDGLVNSCIKSNVTDNGTNTVGDIA